MTGNKFSGMDSNRWQQIENLFNSALQLLPAEREAFLDQVCAGDDSLRQELLSLLASAESKDSFLQEPVLSLGLALIAGRRVDLSGQNVDRYTLLKLLGRGGMGEAYLAHDPRLNRQITLKLLLPGLTGDQERLRRFKQEARSASAISHPNVAHIYEISEAQERHFIAMEYVAGKTLRQVLKQGTLGIAAALDIAMQTGAALAAAHKAGVIHRDVKPENIMLRDDGYVKVLDFGLAKLIESHDTGLEADSSSLSSVHTEIGLLMGTSHYMSPEQVRGEAVDERTDLWSLGVMLYEMLSGRRPFLGRALNEIISAILEHEPTPLDHLGAELQGLLTKALQKQPERRYQNAESLLTDLRRILRQLEQGQNLQPLGQTTVATDLPNRPPLEMTMETIAQPVAQATNGIGHLTSPVSQSEPETASTLASKFHLATQKRWVLQLGIGVLLLLLSSLFYFIWFPTSRSQLINRNIQLQFQRLNLSGNIIDIVISPDGKYVASIILEEGKKTIHIMEVATSSDLRIVPPSGKDYSGLSFSPDGNYLYFLENQTETGTLYRVSKLGGGLRKILTNVNTAVTFSPDGTHMGFIRYNFSDNTPDLIIAQANGIDERRVTRRTRADNDVFPGDMHGVGPAWGPDKNILICPTRNQKQNPQQMNLDVIEVASGQSRRLNSKPWHDISRITWLADGSGLLIAATESPNAPLQLTLVSYPSGEVHSVTNDPNNYSLISGTSDSKFFLTLNVEENSSIWRISQNGQTPPVPLNVSQKRGVLEVISRPDGNILYTVDDGKTINFWTLDTYSESVNQLTFEASKNYRAAFSPDQRYIMFVSSRAGASNIWRMDADGTQQKQLTSGSYEDMPSVTPDGQWIIYRGGGSISKVSIDGGAPVKLLNFSGRSMLFPALSPDGTMVAFFINDGHNGQRWHLEVYNLNTLKQVKAFNLPETARPFNGVRWTRDNKGLTYVSTSSGASNLWLQPLNGGEPKQLTDFKDAELISFDWSANGEQIICVRTIKTSIPVLVTLF